MLEWQPEILSGNQVIKAAFNCEPDTKSSSSEIALLVTLSDILPFVGSFFSGTS
jgi:hypothetical protein